MTRPFFGCVLGQGALSVSDAADQQREKSIADLGLLVEGAMSRWESSGCFHARGQADNYRVSMEALIRGRSACQIERMEEALGLAV